jgi:hypothetical protein
MRLLLLLAAAATSFAQVDTGTIAITASRNVTAVPDQVVYSVTLRAERSMTLADAVARLSGTGITAANLSYVDGTGSLIAWTFELVAPFSKMSELNAALKKLQPAVIASTGNPGIVQWPSEGLVTFQITSQRISPDVVAQACSFPALVSDARKEADRVATAAGVHVGSIAALLETPPIPALPIFASTLIQYRTGSFSSIPAIFDPSTGGLGYASFLLGYPSLPPVPTPPPACGLVVQFRLVP